MTRCDNIEGKLRDALVLLRGDLSRLSKEVNGVRDMLALKALSRDADDLSILLNEYFQWVDARLKDMQPTPRPPASPASKSATARGCRPTST